MILLYDGKTERLTAYKEVKSWNAGNNVDSRSKGKWPEGLFPFIRSVALRGEGATPDGRFGPWFIHFEVPGRTGMGIHAGRESIPDGLGRRGPKHCTLGCIRMTAWGIQGLEDMVLEDEVTHLGVVNNGDSKPVDSDV